MRFSATLTQGAGVIQHLLVNEEALGWVEP